MTEDSKTTIILNIIKRTLDAPTFIDPAANCRNLTRAIMEIEQLLLNCPCITPSAVATATVLEIPGNDLFRLKTFTRPWVGWFYCRVWLSAKARMGIIKTQAKPAVAQIKGKDTP